MSFLGNIKDLAKTQIADHHVAAFSTGCNEILAQVHPNPVSTLSVYSSLKHSITTDDFKILYFEEIV